MRPERLFRFAVIVDRDSEIPRLGTGRRVVAPHESNDARTIDGPKPAELLWTVVELSRDRFLAVCTLQLGEADSRVFRRLVDTAQGAGHVVGPIAPIACRSFKRVRMLTGLARPGLGLAQGLRMVRDLVVRADIADEASNRWIDLATGLIEGSAWVRRVELLLQTIDRQITGNA